MSDLVSEFLALDPDTASVPARNVRAWAAHYIEDRTQHDWPDAYTAWIMVGADFILRHGITDAPAGGFAGWFWDALGELASGTLVADDVALYLGDLVAELDHRSGA